MVFRTSRVRCRVVPLLAALVASAAGDGGAELIGDGPVTIREVTSDFTWGHQCGVKQPLGTYQNGLSVHEIVESNYPPDTQGNPDNLFWVDEVDDVYGVAERPTNEFLEYRTTPGGMVAFSGDGTLWYTHGARPPDSPLNLYSSLQPYDPSAFVNVLFNYGPIAGSTTPCVTVHDPRLMLYWRNGHSTGVATTVRVRRYDINGTFEAPELEVDLGQAMDHELLGRVGIEQLWPRYDPRYQHTFVTWQFFRVDTLEFGSNPFLYSDDDGDTWRTADGAAWAQLPIRYSEITDVLVPVDHLAAGDSTRWLVSDIGVSPSGVFWMTLRSRASESVDFWFFDGAEWASRPMAPINECKPHACGVTLDYILFVYSDVVSSHLLKARVSADDGDTWSAPFVVDDLGADMNVAWVSFVQPAEGYADNHARFFYGYARETDGVLGLRYQNRIRWIRIDADGLHGADIDGDGVVGILDFLDLLAAWGPCPDCGNCPADLDGDCVVGVSDFLIVLEHWD
ncbi:MAG: hypothetical protein ACYS15_10310 [Planctomycetota bacterium]